MLPLAFVRYLEEPLAAPEIQAGLAKPTE